MKILISSCLLGNNVKYDGNNNSILDNLFIQKLQKLDMLIPVCPEVDGGLSTPRVPVEIKDGLAINKNGEDKTLFFQKGAKKALDIAKKYNVKYAILKAKSPSCGSGLIYDGSFSKKLINGDGIAAKILKDTKVAIFTENELEKLEKILFK
ncbi:DUF523 domain-containing protein [Sulfurospirillum sp. 1307]|jgi:uncharacterized protein YbbK (DUF523 family)